ncbi:MAG: tRNA pseudouridine(38-40) synthase TruA [Bacteroidia bacterium]
MKRIALDICYDGTTFAGWQKQPNAVAVQQVLDEAMSTILRNPLSSMGAGRTDAGVHASQLIVHVDVPEPLPQNFLWSLNGILPDTIGVKQIYSNVGPDFHARFDAVSRAYEYHIVLEKSPLLRQHALWIRQDLDIKKMQEAANSLLHFKDFATFCKAHGNQGTTLCDLMRAEWEIDGAHLVFHVKANRFLRGMVRAMVGTLLEVGNGKRSLESLKQALRARDRVKAGANVAPHGLVLTEVNYPNGTLVN